jgi:hypothetical protein
LQGISHAGLQHASQSPFFNHCAALRTTHQGYTLLLLLPLPALLLLLLLLLP